MDSKDEGPPLLHWPVPMIPVATEGEKHLQDIQAPERATLIQHTPACALKLNSPQMGFIPFILSDKRATF